MGNLPLEITEEELRQEFITFGEVKSVRILNNKYIGSGQQRGYGFVEMVLKSESEAAIASLNGKIFGDRAIEVVGALPLSNDRDEGSLQWRQNNRYSSRFTGKAREREY